MPTKKDLQDQLTKMQEESDALKAKIDSMPDERLQPFKPQPGDMEWRIDSFDGVPYGTRTRIVGASPLAFLSEDDAKRALPVVRALNEAINWMLVTPRRRARYGGDRILCRGCELAAGQEDRTHYDNADFENGSYFLRDQEEAAQSVAFLVQRLLSLRPKP